MPIQETVNHGREFLDQFGVEDEGWRPVSSYESLEIPQLPRELLIPRLSAATIALYQQKLKPARPEESRFTGSTLFKEISGDIDPFNVGYTWEDDYTPSDEYLGVQWNSAGINTLHTQGGYSGFFRPSIAEVLAAVDKSGRYTPGDEAEYYWTKPFSESIYGGIMWPNVSVEVQHNGDSYAITGGEYHLGKTTISSLAPPETAERILNNHARALREEQLTQ